MLLRLAQRLLEAADAEGFSNAASLPAVMKLSWLRRSLRVLLTGVAESIRTLVFTPACDDVFISRW